MFESDKKKNLENDSYLIQKRAFYSSGKEVGSFKQLVQDEYNNGMVEKMVDLNIEYFSNKFVQRVANESFITLLIDTEPVYPEVYEFDAERNRLLAKYHAALDAAISNHGLGNKVFRLSAVRQTIQMP